jgi:integrase
MSSPFLQELSRDMRLRGYALRTEKTYILWIRRYIYFIDKRDLGELGFTLASKQRHLPTVLSGDEVRRIIGRLSGRNKLIIQILYGSGLRINECLRLRVQDMDFDRMSITVCDGKGRKDRQTLLAAGILCRLTTC